MNQLGQFIINHWALWTALLVILVLILINEMQTQRKKAEEVSPQKAVNMINNENATIIDLRDKENYKKGHIINSIRASVEDFEQKRMEKFKSQPLILVCPRGLQSSALANQLKKQGYLVHVLAGGIEAWQNAELPLNKGK